jgi:hypothetical protein
MVYQLCTLSFYYAYTLFILLKLNSIFINHTMNLNLNLNTAIKRLSHAIHIKSSQITEELSLLILPLMTAAAGLGMSGRQSQLSQLTTIEFIQGKNS